MTILCIPRARPTTGLNNRIMQQTSICTGLQTSYPITWPLLRSKYPLVARNQAVQARVRWRSSNPGYRMVDFVLCAVRTVGVPYPSCTKSDSDRLIDKTKVLRLCSNSRSPDVVVARSPCYPEWTRVLPRSNLDMLVVVAIRKRLGFSISLLFHSCPGIISSSARSRIRSGLLIVVNRVLGNMCGMH